MAQPNMTLIEHPNSSDLQRAVPAPFLTKTYRLVDDSSTDEIISWNECGSAFVVWRPPEFARDLLPNYFKHNNFSSFVRQLNTYGFKKIVPDRWEFAHEFFRKGKRHLLIDIHRRKTVPLVPIAALPAKRPVSPSKSGDDEQASSSSSSPPLSPRERISISSATVPAEAERLKKENMLLAAEVSCLRRLCTDLVVYIQKYARGSGEDLTYIRRVFDSSGTVCSGHEPTVNERVMTGHVMEALQLKLDSCTQDGVQLHASSPHDKVFSLCELSSQRDPPKLFGVPLPCRRRRGLGMEEEQSRKREV